MDTYKKQCLQSWFDFPKAILLHYFIVYSRTSFPPGSHTDYLDSAKMYFRSCVLITAVSLIEIIVTIRLEDLTCLPWRPLPFHLARRERRQCRQKLLFRFMQTSLSFYGMTVRHDGMDQNRMHFASLVCCSNQYKVLYWGKFHSCSSDFLCRVLKINFQKNSCYRSYLFYILKISNSAL